MKKKQGTSAQGRQPKPSLLDGQSDAQAEGTPSVQPTAAVKSPASAQDAAFMQNEGAPAGQQPEQASPQLSAQASAASTSIDSEKLGLLTRKLDEWADTMESLRLADYARYVNDRKRVIRTNFLAGMARGVGMAIGFTLLGAVLVLVLQDLAKQNLPLIGEAITRVLEVVQNNMQIK